jgi:hypothetical protein
MIFAGNLSYYPSMGFRFPVFWGKVASLTQLSQQWGMFAPYPRTDDGWYVIEGVLMDTTRIDLWRGYGAPTDAKPANVAAAFRDSQWRKYLSNLWFAAFSGNRIYFGRYLCRTWNETHAGSKRVNLIFINYMLETTPPPGQPLPTPRKLQIWRQYCFDKPSDW